MPLTQPNLSQLIIDMATNIDNISNNDDNPQFDEMTESLAAIQDILGQTCGGYADIYWSDERCVQWLAVDLSTDDKLNLRTTMLRDYVNAELVMIIEPF